MAWTPPVPQWMTDMQFPRLAAIAAVFLAWSGTAAAADVTIGYQPIYNPWKVAIADGEIEKRTGATVTYRRYDSGAKVIAALAAGEVDIAVAGSSPIAAGVSRGLAVSLFWILEDINAAEALVVRDGAGIAAPQDLAGKRIGVPFVSTAHYHTLFMLDQFRITADGVTLLNQQPADITAAWARGDIDAAFVWDPVLSEIKQTGRVLLTSGTLSSWGRATFDGMVVSKAFSAANPDFMQALVTVLIDADERYRTDGGTWTADSEPVRKIAQLAGGNPEDVVSTLKLYRFPTVAEQLSSRWLGGGARGGAATALRLTAEFLRDQNKIQQVLADYGAFVTPAFVEAAIAP